jgi:prepilin-type N-terminal cleavage/methylation domain-containing protein
MRRPRDERGFTLPELMVALSILGMIMAPLTASIFVGLRTIGDSQQRYTEAHGAQLTSAYFPFDVASATNIIPADPTPCGGTGPTVVASFDWADDLSPTNEVTYVIPTGQNYMVRMVCRGGTVVTSNRLAWGVSATPVIACAPACSAAFKTATITVTGASGWQYTVTGTRRSA